MVVLSRHFISLDVFESGGKNNQARTFQEKNHLLRQFGPRTRAIGSISTHGGITFVCDKTTRQYVRRKFFSVIKSAKVWKCRDKTIIVHCTGVFE